MAYGKTLQNLSSKRGDKLTNKVFSICTEHPKKNKIRQRGGGQFSKEYKQFCKNRNIEIGYCTPRMPTGNGVVEKLKQTFKTLMIANLEDCFTIHTGLKITPFDTHDGRKPRTELTNIVKNGKTILIGRK